MYKITFTTKTYFCVFKLKEREIKIYTHSVYHCVTYMWNEIYDYIYDYINEIHTMKWYLKSIISKDLGVCIIISSIYFLTNKYACDDLSPVFHTILSNMQCVWLGIFNGWESLRIFTDQITWSLIQRTYLNAKQKMQ